MTRNSEIYTLLQQLPGQFTQGDYVSNMQANLNGDKQEILVGKPFGKQPLQGLLRTD